MRPPQFNPHAELIADYIEFLGLFGITQEIRFVLNKQSDKPEIQKALSALEDFQNALRAIQEDTIKDFSEKREILPIGIIQSKGPKDGNPTGKVVVKQGDKIIGRQG